MSNFPLRYRLSWLPRFLAPAMGEDVGVSHQAPLPDARQTVRLAFLGDISAVANKAAPVVDQRLKDALASADLVVGNCESPVVRDAYFPVATRLGFRHAMSSGFLSDLLAAAGIDRTKAVLSLANNHALDQGAAGLEETLTTLDSLGIRTVGAVRDGHYPVVACGPLRIGLVAFTQWRNMERDAFVDRVLMDEDVIGLGAPRIDTGRADFTAAVPHWDWEFRQVPRTATRALARKLVEQGVGLIAGHHAHVVQAIECIGGSVVAYGLGDFVGTAWSRVRRPLDAGAVLMAEISADDDTRGQLARWWTIPFTRVREGNRERLIVSG